MANAFIISAVVFLLFSCVRADITCKDNSNKAVDWFIIYKLPVKYASPSNTKWTFPPHLYMDSNNPKFVMSKQSLNETNHSLAFTLNQAYANRGSQEVGYIMYNDEKPAQAGGGDTRTYGHTNGVTVFDNATGLWLVHSVPSFPPPTNSSYMYPDNAVYYGEHMLCVSLATAEHISTIGQQLMYHEPWIYDHNLPTILAKSYPVMLKVIAEVRTSKTSSIADLDPNPYNFVSFANNRHFDADLYADLVAPHFSCDLSTETWQRGDIQDLPSVCGTNSSVHNVEQIQDKRFGVHFDNSMDHSRFAVCKSVDGNSKPWVCVGNTDRQKHQMVRGGGTVCFQHSKVNAEYNSLVGSVEPCLN